MVDFDNLQATEVGEDVPPVTEKRNRKAEKRVEDGHLSPPGSKQTKIGKSLSRMYGSLGMMIYPFDNTCGTTVLENADRMAESLEQLAAENESVRKVLEKVAESSAWGTVVAAHAPVLTSVFMHHGSGMISKTKSNGNSGSEGEEFAWETVGQYTPPESV